MGIAMSYENYRTSLDKNAANFIPLTPLTFLERTADVYPDRIALVHGDLKQSWGETRTRCRRLASALIRQGVKPGDTVSVLCPNTPAMLEAHFGIPWAGAVLNAINHRLDADGIAYILEHGESKVLLVDREFSGLTAKVLEAVKSTIFVIRIDDPLAPEGAPIGDIEYEEFLRQGDADFRGLWPQDEWDPIALNYTSGTTGDPKGVVPSHRGTHLMSMAQIVNWSVPTHPVYLWTLPMFHANGWCFTWAITAVAGTHVCLRKVTAHDINAAIERYGVTHFCAAPIVLANLVQSPGGSEAAQGASGPSADRRLSTPCDRAEDHPGARIPGRSCLRHDRGIGNTDQLCLAGGMGRPPTGGTSAVESPPGGALRIAGRTGSPRPHHRRAGAQRR